MLSDVGSLLDLGRDRHDWCLIWPDQEAAIRAYPGKRTLHVVEHSDRVGTSYSVATLTKPDLKSKLLNDRDRAKLTTILLNLNQQGIEIPEVTTELIDRALAARPLTVPERADRLLGFIGRDCQTIDERFVLRIAVNFFGALAWSESITTGERRYIWDHLMDVGWIKPPRDPNVHPSANCVITPAGHARIEELTMLQSVDGIPSSPSGHARVDARTAGAVSAQAFVAMWFHDSMNDVYDHAIEPAIKDAGYNPVRIDRIDFTNPITEEIEAQIRQSRFVVADVTHGDDGARGGVYLEAGRALEQDIPVIFTAERGTKPHFDISPYPHIFWNRDELPAFRAALTERITNLEELGPGPRLP